MDDLTLGGPTPPLPHFPHAGDERTLLEAFLNLFRHELLTRATGLDGDQLGQTHPPSSLSLSRLIGHMTLVEYSWFHGRFAGREPLARYTSLDWEADVDAEMTRAESLPPEQLRAEFEEAVAASDAILADASLDDVVAAPVEGVEPWNLRWIVIHMIEEYARHCGHADFIRESIDGTLAID